MLVAKQLKQETGFTLLEVMVSAVILAIVLLGTGTGQLVTTRGVRTGYTNSIATASAGGMVAKIRRNRVNMALYNGASFQNTGTNSPTAVIIPTADTTVQKDVVAWGTEVAASLPGSISQGTIVVTTPDGLSIPNQPPSQVVTVTVTIGDGPNDAVVVQTIF